MGQKISEMTPASALGGGELVEVSVPLGSNYSTASVTVQQIADLAPGGDTVTGKHAVPVMAVAITPRQSGGCATIAVTSGASGQPDFASLAFDATTAEYAEFALAMPESWNEGTVTFKPHWSHASTTLNFGVCWKLRAVAIGNGDALAANFGTAQSSVDTGGSTDTIYTGPESSAITIAGTPAAGDLVFFQVYREPTDGGDTLAIDARLHGITVYITTAAATDA